MEKEDIVLGWKDILAFIIAFVEIVGPYVLISMTIVGLLMFLFSLI